MSPGADDLAQGAFVSRHAMTVAQVEAVLVDYPGHEEGTEEGDAGGDGRRSGAKPAACAPPCTTAPPHSTHACALSPGASRRTPTTRCAGILESERSMTSARLSSRQVAEKGARRAIAVTAVLRSRMACTGRASPMVSTGRGSLTLSTGRGSRGSPNPSDPGPADSIAIPSARRVRARGTPTLSRRAARRRRRTRARHRRKLRDTSSFSSCRRRH